MTRQPIIHKLRRNAKLIDAHTHVGIDVVNYTRGDYPYALSGQDLALRMQAQGIDAAVCFPMLYSSYFRFRPFLKGRLLRDPDGPSKFPYETENANLCREIYDAFPELSGKLLPFAFFDPGRRTQEQAAFLRELAARYPLFGIKTAASYIQSHITGLLKRGACLLDFAADHNVPVTLHTSVSPGDPWANVFAILDVVRERPDVRFTLAHTCRFDRRALDAAAELPNCFVDLSAFHIHCTMARQNIPAVASKPHRFPADYRRHAVAMQKIAEAYPETIVWGTDAPFNLWKSRFFDANGNETVLDLPCTPDVEIAELRNLTPALRKRIAFTNTLRFLDGETDSRR